MPAASRLIVASACLMGSALGFEALAGFKMPSLQGMQKAAANKAQFGDKKLVIVTGTSSGLGRATARALLRTGEYHVIGAVRDLDKVFAHPQYYLNGLRFICVPRHFSLLSVDLILHPLHANVFYVLPCRWRQSPSWTTST